MPITNWYLIFTRPNCEKKVVDNLSRRSIEHYWPSNKYISVQDKRRIVMQKPLFTSYVFVHLNALRLGELKKIDGVANLVYWLDKPAVIRDIEIEMMRRFLNEHSNVQIEKVHVNMNGIVKITNEDLSEQLDANVDVPFKNVRLVLPSLGYALVAAVENINVGVVVQTDPLRYNSAPLENTLG